MELRASRDLGNNVYLSSEAFQPDDHVVLVVCGGNVSFDAWLHYARVFA